MKISRLLTLAVAVASFGVVSPALVAGQNVSENRQERRTAEERRDIEALVKAVDGVSAGSVPAPADISVAWDSNHFVKGSDKTTYVPYTVTIDKQALGDVDAVVYIRAAAKQAAPEENRDNGYPWEDIHIIELEDDGKLSRAMALPPGDFDIFVAVKEKTARQQRTALKTGLLRHELTVPDFNGPDLTTSSVIVAREIEQLNSPLKADEQQENPYTFGTMRVVPSEDFRLQKSGELQVLFWIYGMQETEGKPDVTIEYNFHQKTPEGEKYFNKTAPQTLNASTLPPQFSIAAGHQLPGSLVVPLGSFPEGEYRLEIRVTDKVSGQTLTQNAAFTVEA